jgi:hypothetical protein
MPRHATGRRPRPDPNATVCIFRVALSGEKNIWRRIAVRSDQTLDDLHAAIFDAFDRWEEHMYSFHTQPLYARRGPDYDRGNTEYTSPIMLEEPDPFSQRIRLDASQTKIAALQLNPGGKLYYMFDFGDSWWHDLTVEATGSKPEYARRYPWIIEKHGTSPPQYEEADE